ncbi:MAG: hypothetical protein DSZ02_08805 [Gammaproteobacteria bacterium]|nr:MAG: hypothetical protein DSZ02_08805 [Gammaproteobacteria bacterium]
MIQDVDRNLAQSFGLDHPRGALVARVIPDSPAAQSGLQVGDIVLSFNGNEIRYSSQLPPLVGSTRVGDTVSMEILRNGKTRTLQVKILELPREESEAGVEKKAPAARPKGDRLGLVVAAPTAEERRALELPEGQGVIVRSVRKGAAATAGIEPGDAILRIDGHPVQGEEDYRRLVSVLEAGRNVAVLVQKPGGPVFVALRASR